MFIPCSTVRDEVNNSTWIDGAVFDTQYTYTVQTIHVGQSLKFHRQFEHSIFMCMCLQTGSFWVIREAKWEFSGFRISKTITQWIRIWILLKHQQATTKSIVRNHSSGFETETKSITTRNQLQRTENHRRRQQWKSQIPRIGKDLR